jgi:ABC-type nitrate/sulfonate/bicarbonate transport system substrate-binding protein
MSSRTPIRTIAGFAAAAILAAACGGGAVTPAATTAATAAPAAAASAAPAGNVVTVGTTKITLPKAEKTNLKIGQSGGATSGLALQFAARALKLYEKYGLTIEWFTFSGGAQANQALLAGQVDMADNSGGPVVASLATDSPLQIVFVSADNGNDNIFAQSKIKTAADLKGKTLAISGFGSSSHAAALAGLKKLGLTDKDVTLTIVGDNPTRLAALKAGSVDASVQKTALFEELTKAGFTSLVDMSKSGGVVARTSMVVPPAFQDKYPNTVLTVTAVMLEAVNAIKGNMDKVAEQYASEGQIPVAQAKKELTEEISYWSPFDGRCSDDVARTTQGILLKTNPALANIDPTKYCTNKYLDILKGLGFQKALAIPGY